MGTGIQLAVGTVDIYTSASSPGNLFSNSVTSANQFLDQLGSVSFPSFCLAHAFTYQDFSDNVVGLAWVGTLCDASGTKNHGITTGLNLGSKNPQTQIELIVSHEVGHNFGMQHDDKCTDWCSDNPSACDNGVYTEGDAGGKYVMWSRSVDGSESNNKRFSRCSTETAGDFINTKGVLCFNNLGQDICGNGVVQGTEQCDCGETDPVACALKDPCCTVNCTLSDDYDGLGTPALCSPNAGVCCTPTCQLKGLPDESIQCRKEEECYVAILCSKDTEHNGTCPDEVGSRTTRRSNP